MNRSLYNSAKFIMSVDSPQKLGEAQAEVAFVGRSNVGKSSLINAFCDNSKLAKVSKTPGKTRTINVYAVRHGKWIVDLPGYGFAAVSKKEKQGWGHMIEYYLSGRNSVKCVFALVDAYTGATNLDQEMIIWLQSIGMPYYVVANKIDRLPATKIEEHRKALASTLEILPENIILVSAKKGTGMSELHSIVSGLLDFH